MHSEKIKSTILSICRITEDIYDANGLVSMNGAWLASVLLVINSVSLIGYLFLFRALNV